MFYYVFPDNSTIPEPPLEKEAKEARAELLAFFKQHHAAFKKLDDDQQEECSSHMRKLMLLPGRRAAENYLTARMDLPIVQLDAEDIIKLQQEQQKVEALLVQ